MLTMTNINKESDTKTTLDADKEEGNVKKQKKSEAILDEYEEEDNIKKEPNTEPMLHGNKEEDTVKEEDIIKKAPNIEPILQDNWEEDTVREEPIKIVPIEHEYTEEYNPTVPIRDLNTLDKIKIVFFAITILPIRVLLILIIFIFQLIILNIGLIGMDQDKPITGYRKRIKKIVLFLIRLQLTMFGIYCIKHTGKKVPPDKAPVIVCGPHTCWLDGALVLVSYAENTPIIIIKDDIVKIPFIGNVVKFLQFLTVDRSNITSKDALVDEMKQKINSDEGWPQILIFPEGAGTNGKSMLRFMPGAFNLGKTVEPMLVRFNNKTNVTTWMNDGSLVLTMCQLITYVEVEFLKPYTPTQAELKDPVLFMNNVKHTMANKMGIPVCPYTYRQLYPGTETEPKVLEAGQGLRIDENDKFGF